MKKLNLNSIIYVKLSDSGKAILHNQYAQLEKCLNKHGSHPIEIQYPKPNEYGFYEFTVWQFMQIYGKKFVMGASASDMPLEDLNFYIAEQDLEEMCE